MRNILIVLCFMCLSVACSRYNYYPDGHKPKVTVSAEKRSVYIVEYGDTMYSIGNKLGKDYKALAKSNGISKPYIIYVGQRLYTDGKHIPASKPNKPNKSSKTRKKSKYTSFGSVKKHPSATRSTIQLIWPTKGVVTSKFGPRKNRMHDGIDIGAKTGTDVVAAAAGKVVYSDSKLSGYGNLIIIRHSKDMFTAYAHNVRNLVHRGDRVVEGQHIADVGATGRATGPHLHFEVRRGKTPVDPLKYLPKH